jgi:hypothetical protein
VSRFRRLPLAVLALLVVALAAACGGSDEPAEPTIAADVDAIRTASAQAMADIDTARFSIERSGAVVHVDEGDTLAFERAEGRYAAPSSAEALVTVNVGSLTAEIGAIAIEGTTWITNPATGRWEVAPEDLSFDPASLFKPDFGWTALLADGLRQAELLKPAPDGDNRYHLRGIADAGPISTLTSGLVDESVPIDLWIDATSGYVVEARFDAGTGDDVSSWRLVLSDYGTPVEIEPPELGSGS